MRRVLLGFVISVGWWSVALADARGWDYLIAKLVADGVPAARVAATFNDPRLPAFDGLDFGPGQAHEPRSMYRHFLRPATVAAARRCRLRYADAFVAAERAHGVSADVVAAILFVESGCGGNTGSYRIFHRLARLAMAREPFNLQRNLDRYTVDGAIDADTARRMMERGHYLEDTFYPEVRALFEAAARMGVDPLEVRGSGSGAFGAPQFLPTSYLHYGTDGDDDGRISLYDPNDAAASCANYFAGHGWHPGLSRAQQRAAVWQYNRSDAYVDAVLTLASRLHEPPGKVSKKPAPRSPSKRQSTRPQRASAAHHKARG